MWYELSVIEVEQSFGFEFGENKGMSEPRITITLGRSGQKVVKVPRGDSGGSQANAPALSGRKRSVFESLGSTSDHSVSYTNKRWRGDQDTKYSENGRLKDDKRIDPKDLRVKLMQKRMARSKELEIEESKRVESHMKASRGTRSLEPSERSLLRGIQPSRRAAEAPLKDTLTGSYGSRYLDELRPLPSSRVIESSSVISVPRSTVNEVPRVPMRKAVHISSTGHTLTSNLLYPSTSRVHLPMTSRVPVDAGKLIPELPPASGGVSGGPYPNELPLTVGGLLQSLGLGKYAIHFQAEEVDMAVLKQMGERDLKELGIPMGPRKKILLAMLAHKKRATATA